MEYCKKCLIPDTRPGLTFNANGICAACVWHDGKEAIDWQERLQELQAIADWAKKNSKGPWDCVLGVSGGKDSTWQAMVLRDLLGLNPLLVQYSCSEGTDLGRYNLENMVNLGFSLVSFHPSPEISRRLSKKSFINFGNIVKYSECCLFPIPYRVAMSYEIPLVFFGENPALECGDNSANRDGWDATTIKYNNTLSGGRIDPWLGDGITKKDILPYSFPEDEEFALWGGRGVYMGYYLNWSGYRNAIYALQNGFKCRTETPEQIGDVFKHNSLDFEFVSVNSMLKHIKLGFGHTTEFVNYEVRTGRLTREEGILLLKHFDGKCDPKIIKAYCDWIGISSDDFWKITEKYYGTMWKKNASSWKMIEPIWEREPPSADLNVEKILARISTERLAKKLPKLPLIENNFSEFNMRVKEL